MITRDDVLSDAVKKCLKEIYSLAQPKVSWEDFEEQNKIYLKKEKEYYTLSEENRPSYKEYLGPRPYEFYYIPKDILNDIYNNYVYAYKIDEKENLLSIIDILKNYCIKPIITKDKEYINPENLLSEVESFLSDKFSVKMDEDNNFRKQYSKELVDLFFKFLDMAGDFFKWNGDLNNFGINIYLGPSPSSNKQAVIDNWKKYRNKDIEIDETKYNDDDEEYYNE